MTPPDTSLAETLRPQAPAGTFRLFAAGDYAGLQEHLSVFGALDTGSIGPDFIGVLEASGLTGRGGAAFASWRKMAATAESGSAGILPSRPVVIANGAEGEPLSFKDRTLLANSPHLVLDGLLAANRAVAGSQMYLYAAPDSLAGVAGAIAERPDARRIRLVPAPETFVAGEASAVVNAIATGTALPLDKRRRLSEAGLKGRPTLVLNVETLAHIGLIARYGAAWFRSTGSPADPGTRLLTVSGPGPVQVQEVPGNAALGTILHDAGIDARALSAVLVGGYHGRWVRPLDYRISPSGPDGQAVRPGAGVILALPADQCGLAATARILNYLAGESAKQCGPCMFGLPAMAGVLHRIASGEPNPQLPRELDRLSKLVSGRGACHHPDGTVQLVHSALEIFADDVKAHLSGRCMREDGRTA
ncbi:NADH-ubiquinone oxidoreductase-F iron-sulfur binding region domain-containing protein [Arthrobacter sp. PsM3]|uniref:NADH-ubiquinone oxidoreductase-F iron-sulfur binding region domain-containing protein n=1 Tax=Arthrobacter sp. PsM3 TaxID=3030531 RepID=UPI00263B5736|nr:NADH-ubiquinone oxidoreductase-F iron-sulfur binding region domain-containing protein [Arthrobacter sp. PsM3]MDN4645350.1 NADH-ubiquinone oxidoreductase-F iron-sulfur binding region domain-containing protein [Arthrobacter sp. PsM3]